MIPIIVGAFVGLLFANAGHTMLGLGIGAALGYFLSRIRDLEVQVRRLQLREPDSRRSDPRPSVAAPPPPVEKPALSELDESPARVEAPIQRPAAEWLAPPTEQEQETAQRMPSAPSPFDKLTTAAKNWLTTGNVPVKDSMWTRPWPTPR